MASFHLWSFLAGAMSMVLVWVLVALALVSEARKSRFLPRHTQNTVGNTQDRDAK